MKYESKYLEEVIDDLYDNDEEFKMAYKIVSEKLMATPLKYGLNEIVERADLYLQNM